MTDGVEQEQEETYSQEAELSNDRSLERLFRLYVGENAEKFMPLFREQVSHAGKKQPFSFNFMSALLPIVWFFYRKMYVQGVIILLVPLGVYTVFPDLPSLSSGVFIAVFGLFSNSYYTYHVLGKIRKIEALDLTDQEKDIRLAETGGTSLVGMGLGLFIVCALLYSIFQTASAYELPKCSDPAVAKTAEKLFKSGLENTKDNPAIKSLESIEFEVSGFKAAADSKDNFRICLFDIKFAGENVPMFLGMKWQKKSIGTYESQIRSDKAQLFNDNK